MNASDCPYFNDCSAPLCPLDEASLSACSWFPDEETCRRRDLSADWIARARKIARVVGSDPERGSFTLSMLSRNFRMTSALRGLDPDKPITPDRVEAWLADHPEIKALSPEARLEASRKARANFQKRDARSRALNPERPRETERETGTELSDMKLLGEVAR